MASNDSRFARARFLGALLFAIGCHRAAPYEGRSVAQLSAMLRDSDPVVQTQGAYGLSRLGPEAKAAVPDLIQVLPGENARVRATAPDSRSKLESPAGPPRSRGTGLIESRGAAPWRIP